MTTVVDASVVIAALAGSGLDAEWAEDLLVAGGLAAPHHMPVEVANVLRRAVLSRELSEEQASAAQHDAVLLRVDLFAFEPFAERIWELRHHVASYDAWYVALAEGLDAPLATLDRRLVAAPGTRCAFATR